MSASVNNKHHVAIMGAKGTGRIELIKAFCPHTMKELCFDGVKIGEEHQATFGSWTHSGTEEVGFIECTDEEWEAIGQLSNCTDDSDGPLCFQRATGIILLFLHNDWTSRALIEQWGNFIKNTKGPEFPVVVVGTNYNLSTHKLQGTPRPSQESVGFAYETHDKERIELSTVDVDLDELSIEDDSGPLQQILRSATGLEHLTCMHIRSSPASKVIPLKALKPEVSNLETLVLRMGQVAVIGREQVHIGVKCSKEVRSRLESISKQHMRLSFDGSRLIIERLSSKTAIEVVEISKRTVLNAKGDIEVVEISKRTVLNVKGDKIALSDHGIIHMIAGSDSVSYQVTTLSEHLGSSEAHSASTSPFNLLCEEIVFREAEKRMLQEKLKKTIAEKKEAKSSLEELKERLRKAIAEKEQAEKSSRDRERQDQNSKNEQNLSTSSFAFGRLNLNERLDEDSDNDSSDSDCSWQNPYDGATQQYDGATQQL